MIPVLFSNTNGAAVFLVFLTWHNKNSTELRTTVEIVISELRERVLSEY